MQLIRRHHDGKLAVEGKHTMVSFASAVTCSACGHGESGKPMTANSVAVEVVSGVRYSLRAIPVFVRLCSIELVSVDHFNGLMRLTDKIK